jgi:glutamine synthetase
MVKLEYIWLDGSEPQQLRSKTKILSEAPEIFPVWSFDGSSTNQAKSGRGKNTDCLIKPVFITNDPFRENSFLVLCEVLNPDGTPHETNKRNALVERVKEMGLDNSDWFGWEQEYTLTHRPDGNYQSGKEIPLGFEKDKMPRAQGDYYCGVGSENIIARDIAEEHMEKCLSIGLDLSGINAEVMLGQWEYQIGPVSSIDGCDQLWMSRYILQRVAEKSNVNISLHPKPMKGDWNGSGCHVNFSTKEMREEGGLDIIKETMVKLRENHTEHIELYGLENDKRMTGEHETSSIHDFSYGFSTRDTSIRIPAQSIIDGKGYFEDRRPASNCDPYLVANRMLETIYNKPL